MTYAPLLPPLNISLLKDRPRVESFSIENSFEQKMNKALGYLHDFKKCPSNLIDDATVHVFKGVEKTPSLSAVMNKKFSSFISRGMENHTPIHQRGQLKNKQKSSSKEMVHLASDWIFFFLIGLD